MAEVITNHEAGDTLYVDQAYNALDCVITSGAHATLLPRLDDRNTGIIYDFERAMQAPAMAMQLRGTKIDLVARDHALTVLKKGMRRTKKVLRGISKDVGFKDDFNPASYPQLKKLLYEVLDAPKQYAKGSKKKLTTNITALEKIQKRVKPDSPIYQVCKGVLQFRNYSKQKSIIGAKLSENNRMRYSMNVGATETGRWSSSANCFREGINAQTVTKRRRNIFIADDGYLLGNRDLSQAESMVVAYLSGDPAYIAAHEDPDTDTHVAVARLIWPDAGWTGDPGEDLKLAKQPGFYRHFSRRDLSKKIQHGANYLGTKYTVAMTLHIPRKDAQELLDRYFGAFPGILDWQQSIKDALWRYGMLFTPLARKRQFFGSAADDATVREAVAHIPQSMVGDICNLGIFNIWEDLDDGDPNEPGTGNLEILMNGHDACMFQFKKDRIDLALATEEAMRIEVPVGDKTLIIPTDLEIGHNWRDLKSPEEFGLI